MSGIMQYSNGDVYKGELSSGKRHGKGTLKFLDGLTYEGEWKQDKMHGTGTLKYSDGNLIYKGGYKEGKWHGKGTHCFSEVMPTLESGVLVKCTAGESWLIHQIKLCSKDNGRMILEMEKAR